jgi:hypothetical protein
MKRFRLAFIILAIVSFNSLFAQSGLGVFGGLATPNDKINDIYNSDKINTKTPNVIGNLWRDGSKSGYTLGVKLRLPLAGSLILHGAASWCRFPETQVNIGIPQQDTIVLKTTQNVFPINVGVSYYFINSVIGVYGTGDLSYNFISSTVDYVKDGTSIPLNLDSSTMDRRIGAGFGVGCDLDAKIVTLNLEAKYSIMNMIGRVSNEQTKSYFTLTLGVFFGGGLMPL